LNLTDHMKQSKINNQNMEKSNAKFKKLIDEKATFEEIFKLAHLNPKANLITGVICGYRIEEI